MRWLFLLISVCVAGSLFPAEAQNPTWKTQSPCDSDFSVKVPSPLYREGSDEDFEPDISAYVAKFKPARRLFRVDVWKVGKKDRRNLDFGGMWFIIGGDDAFDFTESVVRRNGLVGKEYVYHEKVGDGSYPRGRIFYARGRIYFVIFVGAT